jgi:uncharacterized protein (TIGR00730 family)
MCREELRPVRLQLELLKPRCCSPNAASSRPWSFSAAPAFRRQAGPLGSPKRVQAGNLSKPPRCITRKPASSHGSAPNIRPSTGYTEYVVSPAAGPASWKPAIAGPRCRRAVDRLNIVLPHEQAPNPYVTPELCFNFHYFAIRKMHFLLRAKAIAVFPGGFGTLDELFETLTLIQTGRMERVPFLLFGTDFWRKMINFDALADFGTIAPGDLDLIHFVDTAADAWSVIARHYAFTS